MRNTFSLPVVEPKRLPPLFCLSVGALLGLLMVAFVLGERSEQKQAELLQEYGSALAQVSAQDVIDSSITSDLVSMHAIMQRVAVQPRVLRAAVHDLEQQLLVQAGLSNLRPYPTTQAFSAAIPLHDSVAGHVTITMDAGFPGESAVKWTLAGTSLLLLILAGLSLYESRGVAWYFRPAPAKKGESDGLPDGDDALVAELMQEADDYFHGIRSTEQELTAVDDVDVSEKDAGVEVANEAAGAAGLRASSGRPSTPAIMHSDLVIALPNRARLEQQLNSERFSQLTLQFEATLSDVLALYGGARVGTNADASIVCVRFTSSESLAEAAFRAVCSAALIHGLTQTSKIHFQLVAEVCHPDSDVKLAVTDTGIFIQRVLADSFLSSRVETESVGEHRLRFQCFKGPFEALLQRQQQQLQKS